MIHDLKYFPILDLTGRPVYVFKVPRGTLRGKWEAAEIVVRAEGSLRGGDYVPSFPVSGFTLGIQAENSACRRSA